MVDLYVIPLSYIIYIGIVTVGITYGYHAYFSHREYKINPLGEIVLLYLGLICGGRSALTWAGVHRMHHAYSDTPKDPHSTKNYSWYVILFSLWRVEYIPKKFLKDLLKNPRVIFFHRHRLTILLIHYILAYILFGFNGVFVSLIIYLLSYLGFGMLNLFGHGSEGPINNRWLNFIAPFEGNHKDHHVKSAKKYAE